MRQPQLTLATSRQFPGPAYNFGYEGYSWYHLVEKGVLIHCLFHFEEGMYELELGEDTPYEYRRYIAIGTISTFVHPDGRRRQWTNQETEFALALALEQELQRVAQDKINLTQYCQWRRQLLQELRLHSHIFTLQQTDHAINFLEEFMRLWELV
jgi:hypothetical protein